MKWSLLAAVLALAQMGMSQSGAPIEIVEPAVPGQEPVNTVVLRNASTSRIAGYIIRFSDFGPDGALIDESFSTTLVGLASDHPRQAYVPGEIWKLETRAAGRQGMPGATRKVSVDFVLFEDGAGWGPDTKNGSLRLRGVVEGWRAAHGHLRRVLKEKGAAAVIEQISKQR